MLNYLQLRFPQFSVQIHRHQRNIDAKFIVLIKFPITLNYLGTEYVKDIKKHCSVCTLGNITLLKTKGLLPYKTSIAPVLN